MPDRRAVLGKIGLGNLAVGNIAIGLATLIVCGGIAGWIVASLGPAGARCTALDYPGRQAGTDHCADSGGRVAMAGLGVTATPLHRDEGGRLCTAVAYANHTGRPVTFGPADWRLRAPDGALLTGQNDTGGELGDGATRQSTQCFPPTEGSGQVVALFEPSGLDGHRGIWHSTI